jgi:hypothetical protein
MSKNQTFSILASDKIPCQNCNMRHLKPVLKKLQPEGVDFFGREFCKKNSFMGKGLKIILLRMG